MTIDEIREIIISPDALMKRAYGQILLDVIDRLKERAEKAEAEIRELKHKTYYLCSYCVQSRLLENYTTRWPKP